MLEDAVAGPVYKLLVYEALNNPSCLRALATGNGDIGDLQQQTMVMISLNYMLNLARPSQQAILSSQLLDHLQAYRERAQHANHAYGLGLYSQMTEKLNAARPAPGTSQAPSATSRSK